MFEPRRPEPRSLRAILISVAIHGVVGAALLHTVVGVSNGRLWFDLPVRGEPIREERLTYVAPRPAAAAAPDGGGAPRIDGAPVARRSGPLVAPISVPTEVGEVSGRGGSGGGTGSGVGTGSGSGISRGITPGYDPRLHVEPAVPERVARSPREQVDSVIKERFARYNDSIALYADERKPGDLTFKRGGKTYGWNERGIVLGDVTIPAPLLALLPMNRMGGNGQAFLRGENPVAMRAAIQEGAQRAVTADEFRERVKRIRERKEREREAARKAGDATPVIQQER
jgi:hypothetical protein